MRPEPCDRLEESFDRDGGDEKWQRQPERIREQQRQSARKVGRRRGVGEDRAEYWPETGCPSGAEGDADEHAPEVARRLAREMHASLAIEGGDTHGADQVEPEQNDERAAESRDPHTIVQQQPTEHGGRCAECHEDEGESADEEDRMHERRAALVHAILFVCGFTLIFVALGASATVLGRLLLHYRVWITRLGGALVILFGLYLVGAVRIAAFDRERRVHLASKPAGYLGSMLVGVAFGAGWTPCLGPILGAILTYTAATADLSRGLPLLLAYSLGLALPFLIAAVAVERFLETVTRLRPHLARVSQVSGALLIVVGTLMMFDYFTVLATYMQTITPAALKNRL